MATYPSGVFAPSNKSNGQVIDASHINNAQDEIVAVEDALINGPLALTRVQVSGGSTLATLNVTGASSFAGALNVLGILVMPGREMCAVVHGSSQTLSASAETAVTFNEEIVDIGGFHSTATNPTRFTCPSSGTYAMIGSVMFNAGGAAGGPERYAYWRVNGSSNAGSRAENAGQGAAAFIGLTPWAVHRAASSGDYLEMMVSTSAVSLNDGGGTAGSASRAYIVRMA